MARPMLSECDDHLLTKGTCPGYGESPAGSVQGFKLVEEAALQQARVGIDVEKILQIHGV